MTTEGPGRPGAFRVRDRHAPKPDPGGPRSTRQSTRGRARRRTRDRARHRRGGLHREPPGRGPPGRRASRSRALVHYNSRNDWGNLEHLRREPPPGLDVRMGDVTDALERRRPRRGLPTRVPPRRAHRDPVLVPGPRVLRLHQRRRHAERARSLPAPRGRTSRRDLHQRGVRHRPVRPIDEATRCRRNRPYAASKIGADKLAESYHRSFGVPVVVLRPFNTYGPRQSARAVIPTILDQALARARPRSWSGTWSPRRDLTYVDRHRPCLRARRARRPGIDGQTIHFGQGRAVSIGELVADVLAVTGSDAGRGRRGRIRPASSEVEAAAVRSGPGRGAARLGPEVGLDEGLRADRRSTSSAASTPCTPTSTSYDRQRPPILDPGPASRDPGGREGHAAPFRTPPRFPKPLVPIGERPILELVRRRLAIAGVTTSCSPSAITASSSRRTSGNAADLLCDDRPQLRARSASRSAPPVRCRSSPGSTDTFLVMNGDVLTDLDFRALVASHRRSRRDAHDRRAPARA